MALMVQCPACNHVMSEKETICKKCDRKLPREGVTYFISYRDEDGVARREKFKGTSKIAARKRMRELEADPSLSRRSQRIAAEKDTPSRLTLKVFIEDIYLPHHKPRHPKSHRQRKSYCKKIIGMWGSRKLHEITDADIDEFRKKMVDEGKHMTFNRIIATMSTIFNLAIQRKLIEQLPVNLKGLRFPEKPRLRYLMPDEAQRLLEACESPRLRMVVTVAINSGMRKSEILKLRLGNNVNFDGGMIHLSDTKNGDDRHLPMNDILKQALLEWTETIQPGEYIFAHEDGTPLKNIRHSFARALRLSGVLDPNQERIKDFHFHDLRHTFASNLVMAGVDLYVVKELLGHRDIKNTQRYAHLGPKQQADAVCVLDRVFGKP